MKILFFFFLLTSMAHAETTELGPPENIGLGQASSFVKKDDAQNITSLGIVFSGKVLEGLPADVSGHEYEYILKLPAGVTIPPFNHLTMNWNPHGHDPDVIYGVPHFDFHFYFISEHQRHQIKCDGSDDAVCMKQPIAEYKPAYYIAGPGGVPMMGWHWVDLRSPEFNGKPFTATYIYGFYNGEMIFLEPMIALSYLQTKPQFAADIPLPQKVAFPGKYPNRYSLSYDSVQDTYWLSLENLTDITGLN
ncbi:DUF5602 domain-containing protein [Bdellovibrio sp. GT3]|uniref:DUF5602 domain-containing protein n=1 Tax=Bdellovibrio sp. GT3 TaxID=3136282 RepID=UPI0030F14759